MSEDWGHSIQQELRKHKTAGSGMGRQADRQTDRQQKHWGVGSVLSVNECGTSAAGTTVQKGLRDNLRNLPCLLNSVAGTCSTRAQNQ